MSRELPGALAVCLLFSLVGASGTLHAQDTASEEGTQSHGRHIKGYRVGAEIHSSFASALLDGEALQLSGGVAIQGTLEFQRAGLTFILENTWFPEAQLDYDDTEEVFSGVAQGFVAILIGFDVDYAASRLRFQLAVGPTFLLRDTLVDSRGTVGLAVDGRPVGVRIPIHENKTLVVDPLSISFAVADFSGIPLVLIQVRTTVTLEFDFQD